MDKQVLELLLKMQEQMNAMQLQSEMNKRFDSVEGKLVILDTQLNSGFKQTEAQFDILDKNIKKMSVDVLFSIHKLHKLDEEVFHIRYPSKMVDGILVDDEE